MRISDWSSDVCSSYLDRGSARQTGPFCDHRWHRQSVRIAFAFGCERSDNDLTLSGIDSNDDARPFLHAFIAMLGLMVEEKHIVDDFADCRKMGISHSSIFRSRSLPR